MKERAAVIGAGVIGLTTALEAQNRGFEVTIYTEKPPLSTTSAKAGAVFEPYEPGNMSPEEIDRFIEVGIDRYQEITDAYPESQTGIRQHDLYIASHDVLNPENFPFLNLLPTRPVLLTRYTNTGVPGDYTSAIKVEVPMIDPLIALPWLMNRFVQGGGDVAPFQKIESMDRFIGEIPERVIFNCTGLGAKNLIGDPELTPVRGQIALADYHSPDFSYSVLGDDRFYVFPRQTTLVLGGSVEPNQPVEEPTVARIDEIFEHARLIVPDLEWSHITTTYAGLRPYRESGPRIEGEEKANGKVHIINTGFGGSGWTFCWGAAEKAVGFVRPLDYDAAIAA